jgi:drug/metabolite transporter (DMT)-like permease
MTTLPARDGTPSPLPRLLPYALLSLASLFWAGNWVVGRALRDAVPPVTLAFWRWTLAMLLLAPFAAPGVWRKRSVLRRRWGIITALSLSGVVIFQAMIYLGLSMTTAINALLLNSSFPVFMILCTWAVGQETVSGRQIGGMIVSLLGVWIILRRGVAADFFSFEFHAGDLAIIAALPFWAIYSVLLKKRPPELNGLELLFSIGALGVIVLLPVYLTEMWQVGPPVLTAGSIVGILYTAWVVSLGAFICWNRAVPMVGANVAGFSMHLMPAFGTVLAMLFLGEEAHLFHVVGIAGILAGVFLATWRPNAAARQA